MPSVDHGQTSHDHSQTSHDHSHKARHRPSPQHVQYFLFIGLGCRHPGLPFTNSDRRELCPSNLSHCPKVRRGPSTPPSVCLTDEGWLQSTMTKLGRGWRVVIPSADVASVPLEKDWPYPSVWMYVLQPQQAQGLPLFSFHLTLQECEAGLPRWKRNQVAFLVWLSPLSYKTSSILSTYKGHKLYVRNKHYAVLRITFPILLWPTFFSWGLRVAILSPCNAFSWEASASHRQTHPGWTVLLGWKPKRWASWGPAA